MINRGRNRISEQGGAGNCYALTCGILGCMCMTLFPLYEVWGSKTIVSSHFNFFFSRTLSYRFPNEKPSI